MISVQPFSMEVIATHESFYLLQNISDVQELQLMHNTPAGHVETEIAHAFSMPNGRIVIAWKNPLTVSAMHNIVAISDKTVENVNLVSLERIVDIYDRPVDAQTGTFIFTNSDMILAPNLDWRCDNGKFGPSPFQDVKIIDQLSEILVYEPVLSVNGVGHLIYIEGVAKQDIANHHLSKGVMPTTGRTLWETLKLIHEWSIVNREPFNNNESVSHKANLFMREIGFTDQEMSIIDRQIPMQIANYLMGKNNARQRPHGILPLIDEVKNIVFKRMASGSVSALEYLNPGMWDLEQLLEEENKQLLKDIESFFIRMPGGLSNTLPSLINTRYLNNKKSILDKIANDEL